MTQSNNYTTIPPATQIVDAKNIIWTVTGGVISKNGVADVITQQVNILVYVNGVIYQQATTNKALWWLWNGTSWNATTAPVIPTPNTNTGNTIVSTSVNFMSCTTIANTNQINFV